MILFTYVSCPSLVIILVTCKDKNRIFVYRFIVLDYIAFLVIQCYNGRHSGDQPHTYNTTKTGD